MISRLPHNVLARIEALAECVEVHGSGVLKNTKNSLILSLPQAEMYYNWYQGYKRDIQIYVIESGLDATDPSDLLYGWGWLAQHQPMLRIDGEYDIPVARKISGVPLPPEEKEYRQSKKAELVVIKQPEVMPTLSMYIIRGVVTPTIIPNIELQYVLTRLSKLRQSLKNFGMLEKISNLIVSKHPEGVLVTLGRQQEHFQVEPLIDF